MNLSGTGKSTIRLWTMDMENTLGRCNVHVGIYLSRKSTIGLMDMGYSLESTRLDVVSGIVSQEAKSII